MKNKQSKLLEFATPTQKEMIPMFISGCVKSMEKYHLKPENTVNRNKELLRLMIESLKEETQGLELHLMEIGKYDK